MFPLGVIVFFLGYAFLYTGTANMLNGGQGPKLAESLGFPQPVAPPSQKPNLMGQPPSGVGFASGKNQTGGSVQEPGVGVIGGG